MQQSISHLRRTLHTAHCRFLSPHPLSHWTDQWFSSCQISSLDLLHLQARKQEHWKCLHILPPGTTVIGLMVQQSPCRLVADVWTQCISNDLGVSLELYCSGDVSNFGQMGIVYCKTKGRHLEFDYFSSYKIVNERQAQLKSYTCFPVRTKSCLTDFLWLVLPTEIIIISVIT